MGKKNKKKKKDALTLERRLRRVANGDANLEGRLALLLSQCLKEYQNIEVINSFDDITNRVMPSLIKKYLPDYKIEEPTVFVWNGDLFKGNLEWHIEPVSTLLIKNGLKL